MSLAPPIAADATEWIRAGVVLVVGLVLAQGLYAGVARAQTRQGGDRRGARAFGRIVRVVVVIAALIYALAQLGVRIGPLLAAAGVGGVALAFAIRSIFENFLAGVLILLRRPFRAGHEIVSEDHEGTVEDINLRAVVLRTYDGQRVFIPNGQILNAPLVNRTAFAIRRSELVVGVAYDTDLNQAVAVIERALSGTEDVVDEPAPEVLCSASGSRPWSSVSGSGMARRSSRRGARATPPSSPSKGPSTTPGSRFRSRSSSCGRPPSSRLRSSETTGTPVSPVLSLVNRIPNCDRFIRTRDSRSAGAAAKSAWRPSAG